MFLLFLPIGAAIIAYSFNALKSLENGVEQESDTHTAYVPERRPSWCQDGTLKMNPDPSLPEDYVYWEQ